MARRERGVRRLDDELAPGAEPNRRDVLLFRDEPANAY
jgi:hypothetical protein